MSDTNKEIEGHEYDGIKELDNALSGLVDQWVLLVHPFFAGLYWAYYEMGPGPSIKETLKKDTQAMQLAELSQNGRRNSRARRNCWQSSPILSGEKEGHDVFMAKCIPCHGDKGQGGIGPNLTDNYWAPWRQAARIAAKRSPNGVSDKGMPPSDTMLSVNRSNPLPYTWSRAQNESSRSQGATQGELQKD